MSSSEKETYGVYLTPHIGKYQNDDVPETSDVAHETWNFGNKLKAKGVDLVYMHGPIGLYEGLPLAAVDLTFSKKGVNQVQQFLDFYGDAVKDFIFFLYQKRRKSVRYAAYLKTIVTENRGPVQPKKKAKTVKRKVDKQVTES
jgi:hypothetical protein